MNKQAEIQKVKIMLGISDYDKDVLLNLLYETAVEEICGLTNRNKDQLNNMQSLIRDYTVQLFNINKVQETAARGIKSITEGGVSVTYTDSQSTESVTSVSSDLLNRINAFKLNKIVNRK